MAELSPAADAIWDAFNTVSERVGVFEDYGDALAAAFEALADQVVPYLPEPVSLMEYEMGTEDAKDNLRNQILAIATELENHK